MKEATVFWGRYNMNNHTLLTSVNMSMHFWKRKYVRNCCIISVYVYGLLCGGGLETLSCGREVLLKIRVVSSLV